MFMLSYLILVLFYLICSSFLWFSSHFLFRFDQFEDCFKSSWGVWEGNQSNYLFLFYIVWYDILSCAYDYVISIRYLVTGALYDCHFVSQWFLIHFYQKIQILSFVLHSFIVLILIFSLRLIAFHYIPFYALHPDHAAIFWFCLFILSLSLKYIYLLTFFVITLYTTPLSNLSQVSQSGIVLPLIW